MRLHPSAAVRCSCRYVGSSAAAAGEPQDVRQAGNTMKTRFVRAVLGVLCVVYVPIYLFVLLVAMATNGNDLVRSPLAWYSALAPIAYVGFAGASAFNVKMPQMSLASAIALHLAIAPAVIFSFLGMGLVLPIFAVLWWLMGREAPGIAA